MSVTGSLYGLAYGDALGKPTEFMSMAEIRATYGAAGPRDLPRELGTRIARVTDDTQMALAVADALLATLNGDGTLVADRFAPQVRGRFLEWWQSPDNDRAPGNTCMAACAAMAGGDSWRDATVMGSKGCGANMRVTPIALPPGLDDDARTGAAQLQAALTHGHPTGLAASELTMLATRWLLDGCPLADLPARLRERCATQRSVYRAAWLGELWQRSHAPTVEDWIARGWDECAASLQRLDAALARPDRDRDPCEATGAGWIAEEALTTALHCALLYPDDPVDALSRAAATSGDSDSIAALTGAFVGAVHGLESWPADWRERIEYRSDLDRLADAWEVPHRRIGSTADQVRGTDATSAHE